MQILNEGEEGSKAKTPKERQTLDLLRESTYTSQYKEKPGPKKRRRLTEVEMLMVLDAAGSSRPSEE